MTDPDLGPTVLKCLNKNPNFLLLTYWSISKILFNKTFIFYITWTPFLIQIFCIFTIVK